LIERIGPFDESLLTNEDYEFNARIRQTGGRIWLDPQIKSIYFARGSLAELARQYWRYGFWKAQMLKCYPKTLRLRQALPPLFVLSLVLLLLLGLFFQWALTLLLIEIWHLFGSIIDCWYRACNSKERCCAYPGGAARHCDHAPHLGHWFTGGEPFPPAPLRFKGEKMQEKRAAPRWRLKPSEQRFVLILGDLIAGYLALLVALYLWAAGDEWLHFSLGIPQDAAR